MRLYNKHKHRKRWAMLVTVKHQPPQGSTKPSLPIQHPQLPGDASEQPRGKTPGQCCAAPRQCSLWWAPWKQSQHLHHSHALAHSAWPERGVSRGLVLAPQTAQLMHNTGNHPGIIESWLQCSAESLGETTDMTWANPGPMSSRTILYYLGEIMMQDTN